MAIRRAALSAVIVFLSLVGAFSGRLAGAINAQDHSAVQESFGKTMRDAFPLEKSESFFQDMLDQNGKLEKLDPPRLSPPNQAVFAAHFERVVLDIKLV